MILTLEWVLSSTSPFSTWIQTQRRHPTETQKKLLRIFATVPKQKKEFNKSDDMGLWKFVI